MLEPLKKQIFQRCEKRSVASFTALKGSEMKIGIKKRNIKNLLVVTYIIETGEKTYF